MSTPKRHGFIIECLCSRGFFYQGLEYQYRLIINGVKIGNITYIGQILHDISHVWYHKI